MDSTRGRMQVENFSISISFVKNNQWKTFNAARP